MTHLPSRTRRPLLAICGMIVLLATACTSQSATSENHGTANVEAYADGQAVVDDVAMTVELPLDDLVSQAFDVQVLYFKSQLARIERCIGSSGGSSKLISAVDWNEVRPLENTTYGRWDVSAARKYGLDPDPSRGLPTFESMPIEKADLPLLSPCYQKLARNPEAIDETYRTSNIADNLRNEAISATKDSVEGQSVLAELHDCLAASGINSDSQGQLDSKYSAQSQEDQIAAATVSAQCNSDLRVPHRLFDLQAKFEADAMANHESELITAQKEKQAFVASLESSIESA